MTERKATLYWPETGLFPVKVVGAHFYRKEISLVAQNPPHKNALVFCVASLVPEHGNAHDANAVLVKVGSEKIGHLSRDLAIEFRARLNSLGLSDQATLCRAAITAGIEAKERVYDYVIELDLDLSATPDNSVKASFPVERLDSSCMLESQGGGRYLVKVWLGEGVLGQMHKRMTIHSWTTDNWDTINYYVLNRQGIGLGHKLFAVPKDQHLKLFGDSEPSADFCSIEGRNAVIELTGCA